MNYIIIDEYRRDKKDKYFKEIINKKILKIILDNTYE